MTKQPVLFLAHGDPMNALYDNAFTRRLSRFGTEIVKPAAVAVFSAHWLSRGTLVGAASHPETIHDFGGFPEADVPVVPVSLDIGASPTEFVAQGRVLAGLRDEGVLIVGSGNVVHNVGAYFGKRDESPFPWATEFDAYVREALLKGDVDALEHYERAGSAARWAQPSDDHLLPLFPCLGAASEGETPTFPYEEVVRSMSMRCVRWG